jgi:hypothetical protein
VPPLRAQTDRPIIETPDRVIKEESSRALNAIAFAPENKNVGTVEQGNQRGTRSRKN